MRYYVRWKTTGYYRKDSLKLAVRCTVSGCWPSCFRLCVCEQIGCRMITSTILYRFSRNFVCCSEMWSLRRLLFVRETGSSLPILEMCGFPLWQFSGSGDHIFQQISTKSHTQIKFSNADFVFNGERNWK